MWPFGVPIKSIAARVGFWTISSMLDIEPTTDRYLTVAELTARWPIGRNSTYDIARKPDFPTALVLLWDKDGGPRSMGFLLSEVIAYEDRHRVQLSDLNLGDFAGSGAEEPEPEPEVAQAPAILPPAKKNQPHRRAA
jgi:predicted DNA-binding transcriptional regulator AlpA